MIDVFRKVLADTGTQGPPEGTVCPPDSIVPCEAWSPTDILNFFISIRDFLLAVGIVFIIIFIVIGGINFVTAGGDEKKIETGKRMILWSVVGAAVILAAFIILNTIVEILKRKGVQIF